MMASRLVEKACLSAKGLLGKVRKIFEFQEALKKRSRKENLSVEMYKGIFHYPHYFFMGSII